MSEDKKVDDKKVEKKSTAANSDLAKPVKSKKSSSGLSLLTLVLVCALAVALVSVFLSGQKLDKQVLELERKIATLQLGEKATVQRVLALEDEFVVMGLKHRLHKINKSQKDLMTLKRVIADNSEMVKKVQALSADLGDEAKRLKNEIFGNEPKVFKGSRLPCAPAAEKASPPACYQRCLETGQCALPGVAGNQAAVNPYLVIKTAPVSAHETPKVVVPVSEPKSGWAKFISLRLFGQALE